MEGEPFEPSAAKALIRRILAHGHVSFSKHAREEIAKDDLRNADVVNVVRGGLVRFSEWEKGSWRYRVETQKICAVVVFPSENDVRVVTAWRLNK